MASYELRRFDTYPPIPITLSDNSGAPAIDLTTVIAVTGVHYEVKGLTAPLITGICTLAQVNVTGTTSISTSVTSVTPTTGYSNGATIYSPGVISAGTTILSGAGTATLTLSQPALSSGTGQLFVNMGLVYIPLNSSGLPAGFTIADTYTGECEIHWAAGGIQTVPNAAGSDFTILVDADEEAG